MSVDQTCLEALTSIFEKAEEMLRNNAFVHQYEKYGISKEDLAESLFNVYETILRFRELKI